MLSCIKRGLKGSISREFGDFVPNPCPKFEAFRASEDAVKNSIRAIIRVSSSCAKTANEASRKRDVRDLEPGW